MALSDFMMALKKDASKVCDAFQGRGGAGLKSGGGVPARRDLPPPTFCQAFSLRPRPPFSVTDSTTVYVTDPLPPADRHDEAARAGEHDRSSAMSSPMILSATFVAHRTQSLSDTPSR